MSTQAQPLIDRLFKLKLTITTVESCTAGLLASLLSEHPKAGSLLESGLVTYTPESKMDLLGIHPDIFKEYNLTSEKVAKEMVLGAAKLTRANTVIATTGVLDDTAEPEIPAGTVCFAWLYKRDATQPELFTRTHVFSGSEKERCQQAALYALRLAAELYEQHVT
ncbi:PncC family amidohydrolase [Paenalcaligenes hominis]|uniref:PncC family amidohydrolase n=1 Tax=Paenalcaligenes hominis TaxID=643674 RepID=A0ABX0WTC1_9BURK|nr:nicotinamide-nucleotide amidohydrolase family protein [Paenalcaligenes hominis]NJB66021.1 PncC family amidohydrolase [Paenalcaligenes hominis]GGE71457.1 hypothetical protein GCM10007278_19570 [Paenalcaligenes hominis]